MRVFSCSSLTLLSYLPSSPNCRLSPPQPIPCLCPAPSSPAAQGRRLPLPHAHPVPGVAHRSGSSRRGGCSQDRLRQDPGLPAARLHAPAAEASEQPHGAVCAGAGAHQRAGHADPRGGVQVWGTIPHHVHGRRRGGQWRGKVVCCSDDVNRTREWIGALSFCSVLTHKGFFKTLKAQACHATHNGQAAKATNRYCCKEEKTRSGISTTFRLPHSKPLAGNQLC